MMSRQAKKQISQEQPELLQAYKETWRAIDRSTERLDRDRARLAVQSIYKVSQLAEPHILFFNSPLQAIQHIAVSENYSEYLGSRKRAKFQKRVYGHMHNLLTRQFSHDRYMELLDRIRVVHYPYSENEQTSFFLQRFHANLESRLHSEYSNEVDFPISDFTSDCQRLGDWSFFGCLLDYSVSVLKVSYDKAKWIAFRDLLQQCGFLMIFEKVCIVCERPVALHEDDHSYLHAEGQPAVSFADDFRLYVHHGIELPEIYGCLPTDQWQSQWILDEDYLDLRLLFARVIGEPKVIQDLQQTQINAKQRFALLQSNLPLTEITNNKLNVKDKLVDRQFQIVVVNASGEIVDHKPGRAKIFIEPLGNGSSLEMVNIPAGQFMMGSDEEEAYSTFEERPQHAVNISSFYMSRYPITQLQWRSIASLPQVILSLDPNPSWFTGDFRPIEQVRLKEVLECCVRLWQLTGRDYRLPSESEWEYACRAGTQTPYYFGNTLTPKLANYRADSPNPDDGTTPVNQHPPNAFGLQDMHGNVFEMCADFWAEDYVGAPDDGSARSDGSYEAFAPRGGGWASPMWQCRSARRSDFHETYRKRDTAYNDVGFRLVFSA